MCDPVSALAITAAVVSATGSVYGGLAANQQGKYEQRVADANAKLAASQANDAAERGALEARNYQRRVAHTQGRQQAAMAANGIDTNFGSALDVQRDTAMIAREDAQTIYDNAGNEIQGFDISANNYRAQGAAARARGSAAKTAGFIEAGSTLLGGASQFGRLRAEYGKTPGSNAYGVRNGGSGIY